MGSTFAQERLVLSLLLVPTLSPGKARTTYTHPLSRGTARPICHGSGTACVDSAEKPKSRAKEACTMHAYIANLALSS